MIISHFFIHNLNSAYNYSFFLLFFSTAILGGGLGCERVSGPVSQLAFMPKMGLEFIISRFIIWIKILTHLQQYISGKLFNKTLALWTFICTLMFCCVGIQSKCLSQDVNLLWADWVNRFTRKCTYFTWHHFKDILNISFTDI